MASWSVRFVIATMNQSGNYTATGCHFENEKSSLIEHSWIQVPHLNEKLEEAYIKAVEDNDGMVLLGSENDRVSGWGNTGAYLNLSTFPLVDFSSIIESLGLPLHNEKSMWAVDMRSYGIAIEVDANEPQFFGTYFNGTYIFELERSQPSSSPPPALPSVTKPHLLEPTLRTLLLMAVSSQDNPFNKLRGLTEAVVRNIYSFVEEDVVTSLVDRTKLSVLNVGLIEEWPAPTGIKVNMLPFSMKNKGLLPEPCQAYWDIIKKCVEHTYKTEGRGDDVAYLTIDESHVEDGKSQRRGGLHTETPGVLVGTNITPEPEFYYHHWGHGSYKQGEISGGIYIASNVAYSTVIYDAEIKEEMMAQVPDGDCRFLRRHLGPPIFNNPDRIYWMTDRTPHEALPTPSGPRQFIRVVLGGIDLWFKDHSDANPNVPLPKRVRVLEGSKFGDKSDLRNASCCAC